jgi:predicted DNA-binding transcriptional regulator AlpA
MPRKPAAQCSPHEVKLEDAAKKKAPPETAAIHQRFGDRGDDDDGDNDDGDDAARRLPVYVRFRDISAAGIARNWPTLTRLIEEEGFPRGVMLSPNIRAWRLDEIRVWLETRPIERKPVPTRWGGDRRVRAT